MANKLPKEKQIMAISALAEGNSIRSIERMTGIHRDTIMRLGARVGNKCQEILDTELRDLTCKRVQVDEMWGFVGKKNKNANKLDRNEGLGDVWTWVAIDADTKLVPCFKIGKRTQIDAIDFITDLSARVKNRVQISSDALSAYQEAIFQGFGNDVDYGQIVKTYSTSETQGRYSPPVVVAAKKKSLIGSPDQKHISTSYVERQNLTMRMHCRRLTRLTNAFSKKLENFQAAIALHFAYYNFVKNHSSLKCTPAMAAGVSDGFWSVEELVEMAE